MLGNIMTYVVAMISLVATYLYFLAYKNEGTETGDKYTALAGRLYWAITAGVIFLAIFLMSIIFDHDFRYAYVYSYSSKELPSYLLFSAFYAGQEGSFLLWLLFIVLVGLAIKPYSKKYGYESLVMGFYSLIILLVVLLVVFKSPFDYVWNVFKDHQGAQMGVAPENGRGMNPILQNYWMAIHPPILFLGYAVMSVPYIFALTGLIKKDYTNWIKIAIPWTILATAILGAGIMLGGFWAYETLGWGGFWGWDPVENSSLLPWLIGIALVHTLIVQEKTGGLLKTNLVLSMLTFIFILYATFLTRSGVLSDTSVHSFTKPGNLVYALLIAIQVVFILLGVIIFIVRKKDFPLSKINLNATSREFFLTLGSLFLLASGLIIFVGTSMPIFSAILGSKQGSPQIKFYNDSNLPIAIMILLTNAISLYLNWKGTSPSLFLKKTLISLILSLVLTIVTVFFGVTNILYLLLVFASFYTVIVNLSFAWTNVRRNPRKIGGQLSHFGLAIMMFGILGSGVFSNSENMHLRLNESKEAFGYKFSFVGSEQIEKELKDREKYHYLIKAEKGGESQLIKPTVYLSDFNNREEPYMEPGITSYIWRDIYISPKAVEKEFIGNVLKLSKTHSDLCPIDTSIKIEFSAFDMMHSEEQQSDTTKMRLGAAVKYTIGGKDIFDTLNAFISLETGEFTPIMKKIGTTGYYAGFAQLIQNRENISMSQALFVFSKNEMPPSQTTADTFTFEVSTKPLISLVWAGVITMIAGFVIAIFNKRRPVVVKTEPEIEEISEEQSDQEERI